MILTRRAMVTLLASAAALVATGARACEDGVHADAAPPRPIPAPAPDPVDRDLSGGALGERWRSYAARFIEPSGRVVDNGNGGISHSEGQGYALVLAAKAGDRATFDRVLTWTDRELLAGGPFAAWRWDPAAMPHVTDPNNATDGDILIAWGLLLARDAFAVPAYGDRALDLIRAIRRDLVVETRLGPALIPGRTGFSAGEAPDGPVLNPSYWVFPALSDFERATPDLDWAAVRETGYRLLDEAAFGPLRLPTEWVAVGGARPQPAEGFPAEFGYNALRIPLYLAMDPQAPGALLDRFVGMWNPDDDVGPFTIDVATGEARDTLQGEGYRAIFALADCNRGHRQASRAFSSDQLYYPATLGLLAGHAFIEEYPQCS